MYGVSVPACRGVIVHGHQRNLTGTGSVWGGSPCPTVARERAQSLFAHTPPLAHTTRSMACRSGHSALPPQRLHTPTLSSGLRMCVGGVRYAFMLARICVSVRRETWSRREGLKAVARSSSDRGISLLIRRDQKNRARPARARRADMPLCTRTEDGLAANVVVGGDACGVFGMCTCPLGWQIPASRLL